MADRLLAILYEHTGWQKPLFDELDRRNVPYDRLHVEDLVLDPRVRICPYALVVNRVGAYPSGGSHTHIVHFVRQYLFHLDCIGTEVVNGSTSYLVGTSKALQLGIFESLGLRYPNARVVHTARQLAEASCGLRYPVLLKPNVGGSGVGIVRFDSTDELASSLEAGAPDFGIDHVAIVQEYVPPAGNAIVRVEVLDGKLLYAIRMAVADDSFNYCPADGCQVGNPALAVERCDVPDHVLRDVRRILEVSRADLGSVEYLVSAADGEVYYFDVNPLSNFVADAIDTVGFEPTVRLVDYLVERASAGSAPSTEKEPLSAGTSTGTE